MQFKKITLLSILSIFVLSGCITLNNNDELQQIKSLQNDLYQANQKANDLQDSLKKSKVSLYENQLNIQKLNDLIYKNKQKIQINNQPKHRADKTILGQSEWVYISQTKENYKARIDTGATTSSINAQDIDMFERDGKRWVRFKLTTDDKQLSHTIETPIIRMTTIIQSSNKSKPTVERAVIQLHVRIGDIVNKTEFTLTDRNHMQYPVLIGRSFLQDVAIVDVSKNYIQDIYTPIKKNQQQKKKIRNNNES